MSWSGKLTSVLLATTVGLPTLQKALISNLILMLFLPYRKAKSWITSSHLYPHPFWVTSRKSHIWSYISYLAFFSNATSLVILTEGITLGSYFPFLLYIWCPSILGPWLLMSTRTILDRFVLIFETVNQIYQPSRTAHWFKFSLPFLWNPHIVPWALRQWWPWKGWLKVNSPDVTVWL